MLTSRDLQVLSSSFFRFVREHPKKHRWGRAEYFLRPYQTQAVNAGVDFLLHGKPGRNGIIVAPTGSGKALLIANIVAGLDAPALVFQPSKEILDQNLEKFRSYNYEPAVYSASVGRREVGDITLATIGSVKSKADLFRHIKYIQNGDLFRDGYLAKLEYQEVKGFDRSRLKPNSTGADYTDQSVQLHFKEIDFKDKVVRVINRLLAIGRKNVLVFTRFIEESEYLVSQIPGSAIVTAETPKKEREQILGDFKSGRIKVVSNVACLAVGFDYPELEAVVLARPSMSLALYYQQVGRCLRPHPDKDHSMVVDMVGLVEQFGKVEDLTLSTSGKKGEKWVVTSRGRELTNSYFGEIPNYRKAS